MQSTTTVLLTYDCQATTLSHNQRPRPFRKLSTHLRVPNSEVRSTLILNLNRMTSPADYRRLPCLKQDLYKIQIHDPFIITRKQLLPFPHEAEFAQARELHGNRDSGFPAGRTGNPWVWG